MLESQLDAAVRTRLGLRIGPEMTRFVLARLSEPADTVNVIGTDARTGVPRRIALDLRTLRKEQQ